MLLFFSKTYVIIVVCIKTSTMKKHLLETCHSREEMMLLLLCGIHKTDKFPLHSALNERASFVCCCCFFFVSNIWLCGKYMHACCMHNAYTLVSDALKNWLYKTIHAFNLLKILKFVQFKCRKEKYPHVVVKNTLRRAINLHEFVSRVHSFVLLSFYRFQYFVSTLGLFSSFYFVFFCSGTTKKIYIF